MLNYCLSQALISVMLATWGLPAHVSPYFDTLDLGLCLNELSQIRGRSLCFQQMEKKRGGRGKTLGSSFSYTFEAEMK